MKTAIVTGGTTRLGLAISNRLRADGWRVIATSHRAEANADIVADFSNHMGAAKLYAAALAQNGGNPPDALVNNAAIFSGDCEEMNLINVIAPQKLTLLMGGRENGRGTVVNILDASVFTTDVTHTPTPYEESKRALRDFTTKAAAMFSGTLRVNAVAPGPVLPPTDVHVKAAETPLGHPTPEAVADAVAWLLDAPFTTGCIIPVDGGCTI